MLKKFNNKKLVVYWIAIGISVIGYSYINKVEIENRIKYETKKNMGDHQFEQTLKEQIFQYSVLITVVGVVLIGGLGYLNRNK